MTLKLRITSIIIASYKNKPGWMKISCGKRMIMSAAGGRRRGKVQQLIKSKLHKKPDDSDGVVDVVTMCCNFP